MFSTINETKTPSELVEWLRLWANGYEDGDALDDNDARQIADAVERVCAPCNAAALREALEQAKRDHWFDMSPSLRNKIIAALSAPPEPPSNAAALREALNRVCYLSPTEAQDLHQLAKLCYDQDIYGGGLIERTLADIEVARAALAGRPRNCDRFQTVGEAHHAWRQTSQDVEFADWLFEEAKQEGGAK